MAERKITDLILICFTLLQGLEASLNCTSPTPQALLKELEKNLFPNNLVRPVADFSDPLDIRIGITVVGVLGVEWNISGLSWDAEKCGAHRVSVPREKLWVPDIYISELTDEDKSPKTPYVYLSSTGGVLDDRPLKVVSSCQLGIYTFPFDVQNCSLTLGSYVHFDTDITVSLRNTAEDIFKESRDVMETNGEWELSNITTVISSLETLETENYSEIKFFIILRRRPTLYVVNLLIPSCFLITVDLFSFLLPPQSVDRSSFKMTLILGYTVFLLIMNDLLPTTGETTPLINVFFSISLALMVASLLETVFITNIQFSSSQYSAVPHWLSVLVLRYLAVVACIPPKKKSNRTTVLFNRNSEGAAPPPDPALDELRKLSRDLTAIRLQMDKHFQGSKASQEWQMIGIVIDRLLFGLYIVFILASFITIMSIWIWNNTYMYTSLIWALIR
ncbi:5-hydroxytryptamine receptor 3A [Oryzias melastigma]|uniref:5-hydroxytryptamine receptor 3A n=1 Tax=Oryzias melastigma TaxID=30732 RepID=A0A834KWP9_ORYME|nr:5-hydroxytryptamine receptor 3A [Oryzias melastigma]